MLKVEALDHIGLPVRDVERSKRYYHDVLGLEELERPEHFTFPGAWFRAGQVVLRLTGQTKPVAPGDLHLSLWVTDVPDAARRLQAAGLEVNWIALKIPGLTRFVTRDPDGYCIEICGSDGTTFAA